MNKRAATTTAIVGALMIFGIGADSCSETKSTDDDPVIIDGQEPQQPQSEYVEPAESVSLSDFSVDLFITENQCFDTAGALITAEPDLSYTGTADLDGRTFTIVYEVSGGGANETYSMELNGDDGNYSYDTHMISTDRCVDGLNARVTAIRER